MTYENPSLLVRSRAPLRISFAGGGTDVLQYYSKYGGCVISATFGRYAYTTLLPMADKIFRIKQESFGIDYSGRIGRSPSKAKGSEFFNAITNHFSPQTGFELTTHSDVAAGSGLGASSTMMVSLVGAFDRWMMKNMKPYDLAETAYKLERQDLAIAGGKQDQYAAVFGGFNFMEFKPSGVIVNRMRLSDDTIEDLQFRTVLVYTGASRNSSNIITEQVKRVSQESVLQHYVELKRLAVEIKDKLYKDDLDDLGALLTEEWGHKKCLSPGISTKSVEKLFNLANKNGARGGKLLGAGGGGYALFLTDEDGKYGLMETLRKHGYETSTIEFVPKGLEVWVRKIA